ncbi:AAA family ATPase [Clostridium intestinale]|uniref:Nuclease SbcCD subunit C n=1 Tax=Clostridium intestinale URNW TaxID=1294142 RepID=U2NIK3_9CLOT|nr:AAA family ATPase [Clostridium intestinale]ERK28696.1 exonuclease SbcC [Clostridium intestinale URNW]
MRPIKLVMSAFGPYAKEEVLDFTNLREKNIFLITGPTGAGKTTIFDALSVALYGEASGSSRDKDSLRSDFAEDGIATYVELSFSLRGKNYVIKRHPQQFKKKSRGEGYVQKSAEAELILPEGKIVTGVKSVDEKIAEILGITSQQFKQIVMLPQGEFRRLLEAESLEREKIFRKIFGTEAFLMVQKNLEEKERELNKGISKIIEERDVYIRSIDPDEEEYLFALKEAKDKNLQEILDLTKDLIARDEETMWKFKEDIENIKLTTEDLQTKLTRALDINKKLKYKIELKEHLEREVLKDGEIKCKVKELDLGRKALELMPIEEQLIQKNQTKINREKELIESRNILGINSRKLEEAKKVLEQENKNEDLRKKVTEIIGNLKSFEPKVINYEKKKSNLREIINRSKDIEAKRSNVKTEIINLKSELEQIDITINEIQRKEILKIKKDQELELISKDIKLLLELHNKCSKYFNKELEYKKALIEIDVLRKNHEECNKAYMGAYDLFIKGQAGILAEDLEENKPCPVCGSLEHPKKALKLKETPTAEQVDEKKLILNKSEKELTAKGNDIAAIKASLEELKTYYMDSYENTSHIIKENLEDLKIEEKLNVIKFKGTEIRNLQKGFEKEIEELNTIIITKYRVQKQKEEIITKSNEKEKQRESLEKDFTEIYGVVKAEKELLLNIEQEIPEDKRELNLLRAEIEKYTLSLETLEKAYKDAIKNFSNLSSIKASSEENLKGKENNLKEIIKELEESKDKFNDSLKKHGFMDYNGYVNLKRTKLQIDILDKEIKEYNENMKSLKDRLLEIEKETQGLKEIDIEIINEEIKLLKNKEEAINEENSRIFSRVDNNKKQLNKIVKLTASIAKGEKEYSIIGDLSKLAKGDNSEKISFERYVLAAYFNEIINAANIRLMKMTSRRFMLKRKENRVKGSKQSGLELEVFDNYTGKARHVKTLSGGESFKASLALALGLADVVQSYTGGIKVDTMFIDEGFGSLDQESLDNAINCLIDLQQGGRLVGIISHVSELKERIDARLEVTPAKEGSHIRFNI